MSRLAAVLTGALLLVALTAAPALAHTRASSATSFSSRIDTAPDLPGVTWRIYPGGEYLAVANTSPTVLTVLGYEGEPYLRIGPSGVERNLNSPATYLNLERYADVAVPPRADAAAAPAWQQVTASTRYAWYDHRAHWMPSELPPRVEQAPDQPSAVQRWTVPFEHTGQRLEVTGTLAWEPGPRWWTWILVGLVLTSPALAGLHRRWSLRRPAAAVVAVVALLNLAHLPDEIAALPLPALDVVFGIFHNMLFIVPGLAGAAVTWRGRTESLLPLGVGSGAVLFHQGLLQVSQLGASQLATIWPPATIKMLVAVSIAQALWVMVVIRSALRAEPASFGEGSGTSLPDGRVFSAASAEGGTRSG